MHEKTHHIRWKRKKKKNEKDPAINFCSSRPVFASSFSSFAFLSLLQSISPLCSNISQCVCAGKIFPSWTLGTEPLGVALDAWEEQSWWGSLRTYGAVSWLAKCHADTCGETCDAVGSRVWECLFVPSDNSLCCSVHFPPSCSSFFYRASWHGP